MTTQEEFAGLIEELEDAAVWDLGRVGGARKRVLAAYDAQAARVKELEAALRRAEQTVRNLADSGHIADADGKLIARNEAANIRAALEHKEG